MENYMVDQNNADENGTLSKPEDERNGDFEQTGGVLKKDGKLTMKDANANIEDGDMMCGIGSWKPRFLQVFAKKWVALCLFYAAAFLFSFCFAIFSACITTLQTRYALNSLYIGLCYTLFEVACLLAVLPIAYFFGRPGSHRPRAIGLGSIIGALSLCSVALIHFTSDPYTYSTVVVGSNQTSTSVCLSHYDSTNTTPADMDCSSLETEAESQSIQASILLLLGHTIAGICYTPLFILTPNYIDDTVGKKSPIMLAIFYAMYSLGPVVGFPFSAVMLGQYVDTGRVDMETIELTPEDPRWVGAWWLGFIVESVLTVVIAIPIIFLPKRFPPPRSNGDDKEQMVAEDGDNVTKIGQEALSRIKEFPRAIRRLFSNVALIAMSIGYGMECAIVAGVTGYIAKYTEEQFRITAPLAANLTGIGAVVPSTIGIMVGGIIIHRMKMSPASLARYIFIITAIACILPIPLLFLGCDTDVFAGATLPYSNGHIVNSTTDGMVLPESVASSPLSSTCNENCECTELDYNPVCGSDGVTYYSPCFAGCTGAFTESNFSSCGCVAETGTDGSMGHFGTALSGSCGQDCQDKLIIYLVITIALSFISSLNSAGYMLLPLRSVEPRDKPFALAVRQLFAQLLGWAPTPLYIGYIIDSACVVWETSECSAFGHCWVYDLVDYRHKFIAFQLVLKAIAVICFLITWLSLRSKERKAAASTSKDTNIVM